VVIALIRLNAQGKKKQPFERRTGDYHFALRGLDENEIALPFVGRACLLLGG
jgi:hypothetical protein